jgi:hypothetical protein
MATTSNSTTTSIVQQGGQFAPSSTSARFKDTDYGSQALGTPAQLKRFFAQLNPIVQQIKTQGDTGVNVGNFDADIFSFPVAAYQSDWTPVVTAATGIVTAGAGVVCFDGTKGWIAVRKDGWGIVYVHIHVTTSAAGIAAILPTEFWPEVGVVFAQPGSANTIIIDATGNVTVSAALLMNTSVIATYPSAKVAPGTVPGVFPITLKVAPGRTPAAVIFMGAKPTQSAGQDVYKVQAGVLSAPVGLAWTWLSGTAPSTADAQKTNTVRIDSIPGLTTGIGYTVSVLVLYSLTGQSSGG